MIIVASARYLSVRGGICHFPAFRGKATPKARLLRSARNDMTVTCALSLRGRQAVAISEDLADCFAPLANSVKFL